MGPVGSCVVCLVCDSGHQTDNTATNLSAFRWISAYLYSIMHRQTRFKHTTCFKSNASHIFR